MSFSNRNTESTDPNPSQLPEDTVRAYYNALQLEDDPEKSTAQKYFHNRFQMTYIDGDTTRFANTKKYRRAILQSLGFIKIQDECICLRKVSDEEYVVFVVGSVIMITSSFNGKRYFKEEIRLVRNGNLILKIRTNTFSFIEIVSNLPSSSSTENNQSGESLDGENDSLDSLLFPSSQFITFSEEDDLQLEVFKRRFGISDPTSTITESEEPLNVMEELQDYFAKLFPQRFEPVTSERESDSLTINQQALTESENSVEEQLYRLEYPPLRN